MIRARAEGPIEDVEYRGERAPAPEAVAALREARTIIIGPSNPVLSIDPILSVLQRRAARGRRRRSSPSRRSSAARCSRARRPTACAGRGRTLDSDGIVDHYEGLIDGLVADQRAEHVPTLETDVELDDPEARRRVAREVLDVRRRASVTRGCGPSRSCP